MWVENYRPTNPNMVIGNEETRLNFITWLKNWNNKSKPSLILGPPGTGKTTLVHAVAKDFGYEVLELNASDVRTKTKLEKQLEEEEEEVQPYKKIKIKNIDMAPDMKKSAIVCA